MTIESTMPYLVLSVFNVAIRFYYLLFFVVSANKTPKGSNFLSNYTTLTSFFAIRLVFALLQPLQRYQIETRLLALENLYLELLGA